MLLVILAKKQKQSLVTQRGEQMKSTKAMLPISSLGLIFSSSLIGLMIGAFVDGVAA
jgi:hypothetical protein